MSGSIVEARSVTKVFPMPAGPVTALCDVSLCIKSSDYVAITGASGCGKSTLLHILGCIEPVTYGELFFEGEDTASFSDSERSKIRLRKIGLVFQRFFLLPMLTAWENIELPQGEAGFSKLERHRRTAELLAYVDLSHRGLHRPSQLSGGEMQRVAIARALANRPKILLADEPTGELDEATSRQVISLLGRVHADGTAIVVVTHDASIASRANRTLVMRDGRFVSVEGTL